MPPHPRYLVNLSFFHIIAKPVCRLVVAISLLKGGTTMKKWIVRTVIILLVALLFVGIIPFEKEISYRATDYEFALAEDGAVASHEVRIEGKYYTSILLKDRFLPFSKGMG